jgi:uncharacterized membrane protein YtjA (UPF0391 family)
MSSWPLAFLFIALLAALIGFTGIIGSAEWVARVLFALFLALFMVSITVSRKGSSDDEGSAKGPK